MFLWGMKVSGERPKRLMEWHGSDGNAARGGENIIAKDRQRFET